MEQCAVCGIEFESVILDFALGKTGEPVCPGCREIEAQAEDVVL